VNVADGEARLENAGSVEFSNQSDAAELAFLGEFGVYASCRVLPRVTIQAGYEFWYLYGVALAFDQQNNLLSPSTGRSLESDNDIFYHGLTAGFQVVW
jgi:hypothetical protein